MAAEREPQSYLIEVSFLEGWELLNALIERRERLRRLPVRNGALDTAILLSARAEQKIRDVVGIPLVEDDWAPGELMEAWGK